MNRKFVEEWLNDLKEAWWNKDIEKATDNVTNNTNLTVADIIIERN